MIVQPKSAMKSKTLWINGALAVIANLLVFLQGPGVKQILDLVPDENRELMTGIFLAVVNLLTGLNLILRLVTSQPIDRGENTAGVKMLPILLALGLSFAAVSTTGCTYLAGLEDTSAVVEDVTKILNPDQGEAALYGLARSYDFAMSQAGEAYRAGVFGDKERDLIIEYANGFLKWMRRGYAALKVWRDTGNRLGFDVAYESARVTLGEIHSVGGER